MGLVHSNVTFGTSSYACEIVQVKFANGERTVVFPVHRAIIQAQCPKLVSYVKEDTIDLTSYPGPVGHAFAHCLYQGPYEYMKPTDPSNPRASLATTQLHLEAGRLAHALEFGRLWDGAVKVIEVEIRDLGPSAAVDAVKATYPRPPETDPEFKRAIERFTDHELMRLEYRIGRSSVNDIDLPFHGKVHAFLLIWPGPVGNQPEPDVLFSSFAQDLVREYAEAMLRL
ncbi:hypothetical protein VTJ49DRAFT_2576 [Mycothermus thermophilus]|uniref:BTB domain-containing protein n=1 Tax=Humicola insolens TaxID=85995 RepID=A0ABR3VN63_HUMIN